MPGDASSTLPVDLEKLLPLFEEVFSKEGEFSLVATGTSMLPMLRGGRDVAILARPPRRLKKYDVALYRRADGSFVLHRVIAVRKDGYVLCGDNQVVAERGIAQEQVLAVLTAFLRDGVRISCSDPRYRRYAAVRTALRPVRRAAKKGKRVFNRLHKQRGEEKR